jgi:CRISPR-associated endonuclease/helicase Cas3
LFLHGAQRASADVEIVWRKDLTQRALQEYTAVLGLTPPRSGETLSVPIWNVRQWLARASDADQLGDLEGGPAAHEESASGRQVLRWRGDDDSGTDLIWPHEIRPGDVIVVPASYGGCDDWGWTGLSDSLVSDYGLEAAARLKQSKIAVRFHPALFTDEQWARVSRLIDNDPSDAAELLILLKKADLPDLVSEQLDDLKNPEVLLYDEDLPSGGFVLSGARKGRPHGEPSTESDDIGSFGDRSLLSYHTQAVVTKASEFAAGLGEPVRRALEFAAELHDSGKGDRRFQANLYGGPPGLQILAKSAHRATKASALPEFWRHEALSVRVAIADARFSAQADSMDRELALWLIGTHHGWGRPFFPHDDPLDESTRNINAANGETILLPACPGPQRLSFDWEGLDWASLFDLLQRRYGAWGLARLEAILRLADHRASEENDATRAHTSGS